MDQSFIRIPSGSETFPGRPRQRKRKGLGISAEDLLTREFYEGARSRTNIRLIRNEKVLLSIDLAHRRTGTLKGSGRKRNRQKKATLITRNERGENL